MDEQKVPYIVFEGEQARHERTVKRLILALLISVSLLFASNMAWLWFFNSFDTEAQADRWYLLRTFSRGVRYVGTPNKADSL